MHSKISVDLIIHRWRPYVMIAALSWAAYAPTLQVGFLWDDHVIIEHNPHLQTWSWETLKHDFLSDNTQGTGDNYYRPLQALGHRIDYTLAGAHPLWYHLTDLLVHIANAILLFLLVLRLEFSPLTALMTASLFGVHPIGVEQFLVASGRTTPLSFFFSLASLLCVMQPSLRGVLLGMVSFVLALLTKEISVITPAWAALLFYYTGVLRKKWPVLLAMAFLTLLYLGIRQRAVHQVIGPLDPGLLVFFLVKVFPRMLWHYVTLILVPWNLHSHRLIPRLSPLWPLYLAGTVGWGIWLIRKNHKRLLFCLGWVVLGLLPAIPIMIRGSFMLDHWGYPIALGVLLPLSILLTQGCESRRRWSRQLSFSLFFAAVIAWALLVHLNTAVRGTDEKMYRWALHFTDSNPIKYNLGVLLLQTGRPHEAIDCFVAVRGVYPEDAKAARALSAAYWASGHPGAAIQILETFERAYPGDPDVRAQLRGMKKQRPPASNTR